MNRGEISRRSFLKCLGATAVLAGAGGAVDGFLIEPGWISRPIVPAPIDSLPPPFHGYRILHITDIHLGVPGSESRLNDLVDICHSSTCDLIAFTGDFVSFKKSTRGLSEALSRIRRPRDGMVAVLGNHDHWTDADAMRAALERNGIENLTNRGRLVERNGEALWIGGTGDFWEDIVDVDAAMRGAPPESARILLSHNPDVAEVHVSAKHRIALQLSGHTHGGQVKIPFGPAPLVPSAYGQKYLAGLVQAPHTRVFVSRGVGLINPPVRFNCRPEIPIVQLNPRLP